MTKKHEQSERAYQVYTKTHDDEQPLEEERAKIRRKKADAARHRRKGKARLKRQLREIMDVDDLDAWQKDLESDDYGDYDDYDDDDDRATWELRNAHTHKQRLAALERHENPATAPAGTDSEDARRGH